MQNETTKQRSLTLSECLDKSRKYVVVLSAVAAALFWTLTGLYWSAHPPAIVHLFHAKLIFNINGYTVFHFMPLGMMLLACIGTAFNAYMQYKSYVAIKSLPDLVQKRMNQPGS